MIIGLGLPAILWLVGCLITAIIYLLVSERWEHDFWVLPFKVKLRHVALFDSVVCLVTAAEIILQQGGYLV